MSDKLDLGGNDLAVNQLYVGASTAGAAGTLLSGSEITVLDSVTAGTVSASKAVIVDSNKDIAGFSSITINGTPTGHAIDLDSVTLAADKGAIHAGSYSSPLTLGAVTNLLAQFHAQSAGAGGGYDYCIFSSLKSAASTDNMIGIHNTCHVISGGSPKTVQAIQGHTYVESGGSLATRGGDLTAGMYSAWFKTYMDVGATLDSGSYAAAVWLDNQLNGTKNGTTYSIYSSSGATSTAWAGFANDAAGWTNFLRFEGTATPPVYAGDKTGGAKSHYLLVDMNGTAKAIQMYDV